MYRVLAHRGASHLAPENTLSALKAAKAEGAQWVECDVQLTKDNVAVIFHDETLERTTTGTGVLSETDFASLQALDAGSWFSSTFKNEKIPTLKEYLQKSIELKININLELKPRVGQEEDLITKVHNTIQSMNVSTLPEILLSSFSTTGLKMLNQLSYYYAKAVNIEEWQEEIIAIAKELNCHAIHMNHQALTANRIKLIKKYGFKLRAYTINDRLQADHLFSLGVDAIFTDHLDLFKDKLGARNE